jgi:hypothetical protein
MGIRRQHLRCAYDHHFIFRAYQSSSRPNIAHSYRMSYRQLYLPIRQWRLILVISDVSFLRRYFESDNVTWLELVQIVHG